MSRRDLPIVVTSALVITVAVIAVLASSAQRERAASTPAPAGVGSEGVPAEAPPAAIEAPPSRGAPAHPASATAQAEEAQAVPTPSAAPEPGTASIPSERLSKVLLSPDAAPEAWQEVIGKYLQARNPVAFQAIVEARPGRDASERARLLAAAVTALASLGAEGRPAFDDLV